MDRREFIRAFTAGTIMGAILKSPGCYSERLLGPEEAERLGVNLASVDEGIYGSMLVTGHQDGKIIRIEGVQKNLLYASNLEVMTENLYDESTRLIVKEDDGSKPSITIDEGMNGIADYYEGLETKFNRIGLERMESGYAKKVQKNYATNLKIINDALGQLIDLKNA